jgi:membrane fusion protein, heavy metal efflux system
MNSKLILASLLSALLVAGCHRAQDRSAQPSGIKAEGGKIVLPEGSLQASAVNVEAAQTCNSSVAHLNGRLLWDEDVTVRVYTPFAGRVTRITTEVGKEVRKGDCLAQIASPDYGQAQADYRKAVSAFNLAERNLSRTKELFEHGAAPQKDLFSAESDYENAQSERERTSVRLALYGGNTNAVDQAYELKSPLDGVVVEKNVNPGQEVRADAMLAQDQRLFSPMFVVTDPTRLWIQLEASEMDLAKLQRGQEIMIHARSFTNLTFTGKIDLIGDSLDPVKRIINVRGSVKNPARLLKAEMFVDADVPTNPGVVSGADVPKGAVFGKSGDKGYVFVEESPGRYERRQVKVGFEHDGKVFVLDGVEPGQRVVTEGCLLLNKVLQDSTGS